MTTEIQTDAKKKRVDPQSAAERVLAALPQLERYRADLETLRYGEAEALGALRISAMAVLATTQQAPSSVAHLLPEAHQLREKFLKLAEALAAVGTIIVPPWERAAAPPGPRASTAAA